MLKKGSKCKLDQRNFSNDETTLILRCESRQPKLNVKLKQRRDFKSNRRTNVSTLFRRLVANIEPTFTKRRQNNVDIMLSTFQPIFN